MDSTHLAIFSLGILAGEVSDFIFDRLNERRVEEGVKGGIEGDISLLHWLEHYHWGMILLAVYAFPETYLPQLSLEIDQITSSPFLVGFGSSLILDENKSETKFAWEKHPDTEYYHLRESSIIGLMIGTILILRWLGFPGTHLAAAVLLDLSAGAIALYTLQLLKKKQNSARV